MIRVGVIGYGYWGPNLVRNFVEQPGAQLVAVADARRERLEQVQRRYPGVRVMEDALELIGDPGIDAVAVATPVASHHALGMAVLGAGKHLFMEKPMAASSAQAQELLDEAARRHLTLMVDHTFVYTSAVRRMRELIDGGSLGELLYYDSVRINLGLFQKDVNVLWDLAVHDLSIMEFLLPDSPQAVSATGVAHIPGQPINVAYLTGFFADTFIAHIHVNWLAPAKIRRTLIGGAAQMVVYDDLEPSEKVKVYNKGVTSRKELLIGYRSGDMWAPHLEPSEALATETREFIEAVESGRSPTTDGGFGLKVIRILEAADVSLAQRGRPVELAW